MRTRRQHLTAATLSLLAASALYAPAVAAGDRDPGRWRRWILGRGDFALRLYGVTAAVEADMVYLYGVRSDRISQDAGRSWQPIERSVPPFADVGYLDELPEVVLVDGVLHHVGNYSFGVFYGRSNDLGATWSEPRRLDRRNYGRLYRFPWERARLAVDGDAIHAVWDTCRDEGFSNIVDCRTVTRSSFDGGSRWGRLEALPEGDAPMIAAARGVVHLVHQGNGLIYRRRGDGAASFAQPVQLDPREDLRFPTGGAFQDIAAKGNRVAVAWSASHRNGPSYGGDIFVAVSHDRGATWSPPRLVRRTPGASQGAAIAIDSGRLLVAWGDLGGKRAGQRSVWFAESSDWGRTWGGFRHFQTGIGGPIWFVPDLVADNGWLHLFYPADPGDGPERLVYRRRAVE